VPRRTIAYSRVVHLSHVIAPDMPEWPGDPPLELDTVAERGADGYYLRRVTIGEHSATHVNAPVSFHDGGAAIDTYAASSLVVPAVVLDVRAAARADADYLASTDDLAAWERAHGVVPAGSMVLLHTGWGERWGDPAAFLNPGEDGDMHFPGCSPHLADVLVDQRRVAGIGIDTHGIDGGLDERFTVNARVLERSRLVIENLANLDRLPPTGATLVIGVLRLRDGSGSPAAVMAFLP
jgi:kynurenine formamidase